MEATLRRIEARNPSLNALVFLDTEGARERAAAAERALGDGVGSGRCTACPPR